MSRYDNVPSSGSLARVHRDRVVPRPLSTALTFYDENKRNKLFLT
ncbi:hypothetical protein OESDEN_24058 [Oesophagostomum dentatum]|uniref:Uncharacterized protein n=1 Tax=Oesophagostomum dentatum TaxID=61180 RepID=A0A0B1RYM3_OESDE|nr:hypothetical protein OESDEN_24058 [Oesophagostomum dentatum]